MCACVCVGRGVGRANSTVSLSIFIAPILALIAPMLKIGAWGRPQHSLFVVVTKHGYLYALITFLS